MHFTLLGDELTRLQSLSLYLLLILTRKVKGSAVTVIWASPRFGHPLPKTLVIWGSTVTLTLTLTQIAKVIREGDAHITRVLGRGRPKRRRGCPYHCNSALAYEPAHLCKSGETFGDVAATT